MAKPWQNRKYIIISISRNIRCHLYDNDETSSS